MKKPFLLIIGLLIVVFSAQAKEWKKVRVGVEGAYPPFTAVSPEGQLVGFEVDLTHALCNEMDVQCILIPTAYDGIIPALLARKFDFIIASLSITDDRKKKVDFSDKYYETPAMFSARKGTVKNFTNKSLHGKNVGVQRSTIHDKYLSDNLGDKVNIKRYGTQDEVYLDIVAGRIDFVLSDAVAFQEGFMKKHAQGKDFEFVSKNLVTEQTREWFGEGVGAAFRKNNKELVQMFNKALKTVIKNGTYDKIQRKYFDFDIYGAR